jgi:hypothetical protein
VEVAEGAEPAAANESAPAPLSLKARLAAIRADCDAIGKQDITMEKDGKKWTIKGHTVEAILSEIRPLFIKHGVSITPSLAERSYSGNRCDVLVDFTLERLDDSDESRVIRWGGAGTDNGDKAFAKAGTNALKEMLKKVFLVTDRDDAKEETESVEHQTDDGARKADLIKAREEKAGAIQQWAKTFKAALETAKTGKDIDRLQRENKAQLTDESLPDVTRDFFVDLIQERKKALGDV